MAAAEERIGSLADNVYQRLKQDVISCRLSPGSSYSETELAERYGASKTPVRYALALLQAEDLVRVLPRRGIHISRIELSDIQSTYALRRVLEPPAAALAARNRSPENVIRLREFLDEARGDEFSALSPEQARVHSSFHIEIAVASGLPLMGRFVRMLHEAVERMLNATPEIGREMRFGERDRQLMEAIEVQDAEAAERIAKENIEFSSDLVVKGIIGIVTWPNAPERAEEPTE